MYVHRFALFSARSAASEGYRKVGVKPQQVLTVCCPPLVCKCCNVLKVFALLLVEGLC